MKFVRKNNNLPPMHFFLMFVSLLQKCTLPRQPKREVKNQQDRYTCKIVHIPPFHIGVIQSKCSRLVKIGFPKHITRPVERLNLCCHSTMVSISADVEGRLFFSPFFFSVTHEKQPLKIIAGWKPWRLGEGYKRRRGRRVTQRTFIP